MSEIAPLKIAYITSGAAGMFCGSCMHDNTLAKHSSKLGCDVQLVPLYTPIRTDEESVAVDQVFMGGINVYLQQKLPFFRHCLPGPTACSTGQAARLGNLARNQTKASLGRSPFPSLRATRVSTQGSRAIGHVARARSARYIVFSNMLTAGSVPAIKRHLTPRRGNAQGRESF